MAQQAAPIELDPVVLYGDRTTTDIDEATASIGIVNERQLAQPIVQDYTDSFRYMANVSTGDWTESGFVVRGINSEGLTPGGLGAPLASFYIDGVQQTVEGTRRGLRGVFDTEQVEVYRGPQSTLTGRAALAGAIYLRTKDPEFARSGAAQLTYGSDNHKQAGLAFGDAINDRIAYRVSGEWSEKDSDLNYPSYARYDRYDDYVTDDYWVARGKVLWLPTENDDTRVILSYARSFDGPTQNDIVGPLWSTGSPGYDARRGDGWGSLLPDYYRSLGLTALPVYQDVRETYVNNLGIEVTHDFNANLRLTAMTGWTKSLTERHSINEGTPGEFMTVDGAFRQELLSQEIRLNYDSGALRWVAGAYAAREKQSSFRNQQLLSYDESRNAATIRNYALFGEASYEFAPNWRVIGGARLDYIQQDQSAWVRSDGVVGSDTDTDFSDRVFIPKLGVEYSFGANQSVALIYQEGYRPGGSAIYVADGSQYEYDPEKTRNLELAWRGRFMQDRLRLGANVFYQEWTDQQVELRRDPLDWQSSYIANAGKSKSYGAEFELAYAATDMLDLTASVGLLHTKFTDFRAGPDDFTGLPFPSAPKSNISLGFAWGDVTGPFVNGHISAQSSTISRLESYVPDPVTLGGHGLVDLAAGYAWEEAKLTAYATNLFDKEYFTYDYGPGVMATLGDRREVGIRLDYQF
ncbi:TonB-dependent receptor [Paracoccus shanxieyensis]|uniref:TonB-dependent receptor n=1 Tax=Paracoccus shanxieyensis TaxID=2675752 RepID=A0A6L6J285_9RHOB|nr:TonB-dependent receptor [Paracoccus shanxieyensis]MTH65991.1 TonB-dependent receptor [Paracoccus shanxieyensis]MTH89029.1 TonB-dependent receptor [Paracoccus shanxieyensis]